MEFVDRGRTRRKRTGGSAWGRPFVYFIAIVAELATMLRYYPNFSGVGE